MALFGDEQLEAALAALTRTDEAASRLLRRDKKVVSQQASDKNKLVTVTVTSKGELREMTFRGDAYRDLAPAELADLLVRTIEQARRAARDEAFEGVQELMRDVPLFGLDLSAVGSGEEFAAELLEIFTRNMSDTGLGAAPPDEEGRRP
jgi:hypothetical protein